MDTLALGLVHPTARYLQQGAQFVLRSSPNLTNKTIRCIQRALMCPGVDKTSIVRSVANQAPIWATGSTGGQNVGVATQNMLALLSASQGSATLNGKDSLMGEGSLSDPFLLCGLYEVLLRTPVLTPTSPEFAFASTADDCAAIMSTIQSAAGESGKRAKASKGKTGGKGKVSKSASGIFFAGNGMPSAVAQETLARLRPQLAKAERAASGSEFATVVGASMGGFTLDTDLAASVEDLRGRLWESMLKRGEMTVGMYTGVRSANALRAERAAEKRRQAMSGPRAVTEEETPEVDVADVDDVSTGPTTEGVGSFDFSDPDVAPYIWRMIASCQRRDQVAALLRKFPIVGNNVCHPPINTNGVGGSGQGYASAHQAFPPRSYARILQSIGLSPMREHLVSLLDAKYIAESLVAAVEGNERESVREWAVEALLILNDLSTLSEAVVGRVAVALSRRPLVSLAFPIPSDVMLYAHHLTYQPHLAPLLPHLEHQLCDAFWNVVRNGNASSIISAPHELFQQCNKMVRSGSMPACDVAGARRSLGAVLFKGFAERLGQDPATERNIQSQAAFMTTAAMLGQDGAAEMAASRVKGLCALQQVQHEQMERHVQASKEALLGAPVRRALRHLHENPFTSTTHRELLKRMTPSDVPMPIAGESEESLASDAALLDTYHVTARLTPNGVVGGVIEAVGHLGTLAFGHAETAMPLRQRQGEDTSPPILVNVLGPRSSIKATSDDEYHQRFMQGSASARLLTTALVHPKLAKEQGWYDAACREVAASFGLKAGAKPLGKPTGKKSIKSSTAKTDALDTANVASKRGFTVPLCRTLATVVGSDSAFEAAMRAVSAQKDMPLVITDLGGPVGCDTASMPFVVGDVGHSFLAALAAASRSIPRAPHNELSAF